MKKILFVGNMKSPFMKQDYELLKEDNEVIIFNESTPLRLIQDLKPDIVVKGGDYTKADVVGNGIAEIIIFNTIKGYSTTDTLNKVSASFEKGDNSS
jgi:bifunctional ADP-heptose synthase (sugar kinase/adenylyltransferase)